MKQPRFSKPVLLLIVTGLLLTTGTPMISRFIPLPDALKGFLSGLGLALEFMALVKADRYKKKKICQTSAPELP
ncbi:hypothetical protein FO440_10120 [Mucilaginibacter corticis]|uniref:Uncharacterized protein n=1 Tax=Mucilaginibacter corticis TaxID=2597670 RepID=A0A556MXF4_9SPHI|nr:hypothetical protein [Mucilaginibacter corticis]TSJ44508.1 hypothetical protein FO440_10120 [Mucilaginibacter corticis]